MIDKALGVLFHDTRAGEAKPAMRHHLPQGNKMATGCVTQPPVQGSIFTVVLLQERCDVRRHPHPYCGSLARVGMPRFRSSPGVNTQWAEDPRTFGGAI